MLVELSFGKLLYEVSESDRLVSIVISLSQVSSDQFEVEVSTMDVTATGNDYKYVNTRNKSVCYFIVIGSMDYDELVRTITIPPEVESQSFTASIIDNNIVECNEKFNVTMTSVTTCGVTIGSNRISEVIIRDDDSKNRIFICTKLLYHLINRSNSITEPITIFSGRK